MRRPIRSSIYLFLLAASAAPAAMAAAQQAPAPSTVPATTAAPAPLSIQPLRYHYRELANGLRVYAMPDPNTANVSVQVWYDVGSKNDPLGRSGFAHLFEHIMFKATRNLPSESFDRLTEDVGGYNNASTADDYTNYYEVVPANHLQRLLWAEAERMGSLVIDESTFDSERDVVKEELRQRVLAAPYGPLFYLYLPQTNFLHHPYGRPGIGSIADLDAATVGDVRAFHATYYRPDNAVLVVAGNFDLDQFNHWVDEYFGPIARPSQPIPRVTAVEPIATAPRAYDVYQANVPLPAVTISWPQPAARDPSIPALLVLDGILTTGDSSRMHRALIQDATIASEIFSNIDPTPDPGAYSIGAVLSEGVSVERGEAALRAQIARIRDNPPTAAELDEAKNEIVMARLRERETAEGRAGELADSVIRYGDADAADRMLTAVQAVTAADVQRVARSLLDDRRSVTIRYRPEASRVAGAHADTIATSPAIEAHPLTIAAADVPVVTLAPPAERVAPPEAGPPVSPHLPTISEHRLENGMRVIVAPSRALPLVSVELRMTSGDASDDQRHAGLAEMTAGLLLKGTTARDATSIASAIESLGATISTSTGADYSSVSLLTRADRLDPALTVLADVVRNPTFSSHEIANARQQALDGLSVTLSEPGGIAGHAISRALYGLAPYGRFATPTTLAAIDRSAITAFYRRAWRPDRAIMVISGDVSDADGVAIARRFFGAWTNAAGASITPPVASAFLPGGRTIVVDLAGTGQAAVLFGLPGVERRSADYFPTLVTNAVLGGGYSARLNAEIRIRRGLSYGANSVLTTRQSPGAIIAQVQTRNDAVAEVTGLVQAEIARLGATPVEATELGARKASLIGSFGRDVETVTGLSDQIARLAVFGLPPQSLGSYAGNIEAVSAEDVQRIGRTLFDPARADVVIVGDAAQFGDAIAASRPGTERIESTALDLDTVSLKH